MPILIDGHADIAYNMLRYGRDYTRAAAETRQIELGSATVADTEDSLLGWPDYQRGTGGAHLLNALCHARTHEQKPEQVPSL